MPCATLKCVTHHTSCAPLYSIVVAPTVQCSRWPYWLCYPKTTSAPPFLWSFHETRVSHPCTSVEKASPFELLRLGSSWLGCLGYPHLGCCLLPLAKLDWGGRAALPVFIAITAFPAFHHRLWSGSQVSRKSSPSHVGSKCMKSPLAVRCMPLICTSGSKKVERPPCRSEQLLPVDLKIHLFTFESWRIGFGVLPCNVLSALLIWVSWVGLFNCFNFCFYML